MYARLRSLIALLGPPRSQLWQTTMLGSIWGALQSARGGLPNAQRVHCCEPGPAGDIPNTRPLPIQLPVGTVLGSICGPEEPFSELLATPTPSVPPLTEQHSTKPALLGAATPSAQDFDSLQWNSNAGPDLSGTSVSLYDTNPITGQRNGDPIADCFGAIQYKDGAILACADGVNWGPKPRLAARCAVHAALRSLHTALGKDPVVNSDGMFQMLLQAVDCAQQSILRNGGTLTTLVLTVVARCPSLKCRYAAMTLSIGDSAAFSFRTASGTLTDLTSAWRLGAARDPRDCQGCLGFALGEDPDLSNMTLSLTTAAPGDILLLVSDGIVDNFDPVARKEAVLLGAASHRQEGVELPAILPQKAHMLTVEAMARTLQRSIAANPRAPAALLAMQALLAEATTITEGQRRTIERCLQKERRSAEGTIQGAAETRDICSLLAEARGKLDHATVVAFQCP